VIWSRWQVPLSPEPLTHLLIHMHLSKEPLTHLLIHMHLPSLITSVSYLYLSLLVQVDCLVHSIDLVYAQRLVYIYTCSASPLSSSHLPDRYLYIPIFLVPPYHYLASDVPSYLCYSNEIFLCCFQPSMSLLFVA
jgi:hypothetical protein